MKTRSAYCVWTEGLNILYASFKRKRNSVPTAPKWLILRCINSNYCVFTAELIISLKQVTPWKKGESIFLNKGRFRLSDRWIRCALPPMPRQWTGSAFRTDVICATSINKLSIIINFYAAELLYLRLGLDRQRATKGPHKMTKPWERGSMFFK